MPLNIHENEYLQTYAKNVTFVSQDSFELSCLDASANGIIHADQGVRISANKAEFVVTGAGKIDDQNDIKPYILASVPDDGSIILDASSGNSTEFCMLTLGGKQIQAIGGNGGTPASMLVKDSLFEVAVGNGLTPATHSKASIKPFAVDLQCGGTCSQEMTPTAIKLKCGPTSSQEITPTAIKLKCGTASLTLSPTGIEMEFGVNKFEISATKVVMKSAESEIELSPLAMKVSAPIAEFTINMSKNKSLVVQDTVDAILNDSVGLRLLDT